MKEVATRFDNLTIMKNIHNEGIRKNNTHDFINHIATTYLIADVENRALLDIIMDKIIIKYNLNQEIYTKES